MEFEVVDKFGRVRRLRRGDRLGDGETLRVPAQFMDAHARAAHEVLAAKYGHMITDHQRPRGFVRGYALVDTSAPRNVQDEAAIAYEERRERLSNAWRKDRQQDGTGDHVGTTTLDEVRHAADIAYAAKVKRLQNAWRNR